MPVDMLGGPRRLELPERLTIEVLADLGDCLREHALEAGALELDGSALRTVDTAGLQWLAVLIRTRRAEKRTTRWDSVTATLARAAERLGMREALLMARARVLES
ncbi:MAG: STAS domain-containing protein [Pseudomonadales bacterium]|jgi:ABC-type transporter Mla MlaB component|nr:STAS domain-containing protein [Pseudomonadales bacterium]